MDGKGGSGLWFCSTNHYAGMQWEPGHHTFYLKHHFQVDFASTTHSLLIDKNARYIP